MHRFPLPATRCSALALAVVLAGCGGPLEEDFAAEADGGEIESADAALSSGSWAFVRRDTRRCAAPRCGGYFVSAVQKPSFKCADGRYQARCYVAELDLSALGLEPIALDGWINPEGMGGEQLIVRGTIRKGGGHGALRVTEAHRAVRPAPANSTFYVVRSTSAVRYHKINTTSTRTARTLVIATSAGDAAARAQAHALARTSAGLVASGAATTQNGRITFTADGIFLKVVPVAAPARLCGNAAVQALQTATKDLLYTSESDHPFTVLLRSDLGGAPATEATVRTLAAGSLPANAPMRAQTVEEFFSWVARPDDASMSPEEKATAAQYRALRALLERELTDLRIFRAGEIEVQVYVLGRSACGELVGLSTISIET